MHINKISQTPSVYLADVARQMELAGEKVIKFQTGDPVFATHSSVIEAANKALLAGNTHYSFAQGLPQLRMKIAEELNTEIDGSLSDKNILITQGAAQAIFSIFSAILELDDEVIILEPNWPTVDSAVVVNGGKPVKVSYLNDGELIQLLDKVFTNKTKAICFNTPNNPTGKVLSNEILEQIIQWAIERNIHVIADEVYRYLQYSDFSTSLSAINIYDKYIFVDSFSKKYAMTGWRIGYVAASETILKGIVKASQINITHVAPFVQLAALEALSNIESRNYCNEMRNAYRAKRLSVLERLDANDIQYISPDGAFYVFVKLKESPDDVSFSNMLLNEKKVCVVPGSAYGTSGSGYIRISYSIGDEDLLTGVDKIIESII